MKKYNLPLTLAALFISMPASTDETILNLHVDVNGASPNKGAIIISVFSSKADYLKRPILERTIAVGQNGNVSALFENVEEGKYAVSAIYDKDENGRLNTGFLGIPTEKAGFSNNVKGKFGPPSFKKTSFDFPVVSEITINLIEAKK